MYFIKDYYWLKEEGIDGVELYNVKNPALIIKLSRKEGDIFNKLLNGTPLESFQTSQEMEKLKKIITKNGIGHFEDKFYIENEYKVGRTGEMNIFEMSGQLYKTYIEIPSKCDKCNYCDKLISAPCLVCHQTKQHAKIEVEKYKDLIIKIKQYGCIELILHGADILKENLTYSIIQIAEENNLKIKLVTHNKMIDENAIEQLKGRTNVQLVINFDVLNEEEKDTLLYDIEKITKKLNIEMESTKISLRVSKKMCKNLEQIKKEIEDRGFYIINVSLVSDEIISEEEMHSIYEVKSFIYEVNKIIKKYNACLYGAIAFDTELNILPCPHMRDYILRTKDGTNNLEYSLLQLWTLTKDKIEHCKHCSKKHRCLDCRALEVNYKKQLLGKRECEYLKSNMIS